MVLVASSPLVLQAGVDDPYLAEVLALLAFRSDSEHQEAVVTTSEDFVWRCMFFVAVGESLDGRGGVITLRELGNVVIHRPGGSEYFDPRGERPYEFVYLLLQVRVPYGVAVWRCLLGMLTAALPVVLVAAV